MGFFHTSGEFLLVCWLIFTLYTMVTLLGDVDIECPHFVTNLLDIVKVDTLINIYNSTMDIEK